MKVRVRWILLIVVILGLLAGVARIVSNRSQQKNELDKSSQISQIIDLFSNDTLILKNQTLTIDLPVSGTLRAVNTAIVKARVAGEVIQLRVREGDRVNKGDVLAQIDPREFQQKLVQAEQQADSARSQIDIAKRQFDNNKALVDQGFISKTALDTSSATLAGAQATFNAAQAAADVARKSLEDTFLKAPISGQVSARLVQPGERAAIDSRIIELVDVSQMEVEVALSPSDASQVRVGQTGQLSIEGYEKPVQAKVQRINPSLQAGSRSVLVYLQITQTSGLRQGLFVQGQIATGQLQSLALPLNAIRTDKPQPYVQIVEKGKVAHKNVVMLQRGQLSQDINAEPWVIVQGLSDQSIVIKGELGSLREGLDVIIKTVK
ncbi:MAG: efflux RND transporter periplasmic adaptor subunit [Betaproteobacteria bacterium]|nr:efflux RND transporter periplasmic adaptor subunit [Betaproteobacteria bacterium]NBY08755.1 efflux RND transporter periplasmic adaptor subunit [Betaproteobacteria bacterium]